MELHIWSNFSSYNLSNRTFYEFGKGTNIWIQILVLKLFGFVKTGSVNHVPLKEVKWTLTDEQTKS